MLSICYNLDQVAGIISTSEKFSGGEALTPGIWADLAGGETRIRLGRSPPPRIFSPLPS